MFGTGARHLFDSHGTHTLHMNVIKSLHTVLGNNAPYSSQESQLYPRQNSLSDMDLAERLERQNDNIPFVWLLNNTLRAEKQAGREVD